jgi:hypothetical protein
VQLRDGDDPLEVIDLDTDHDAEPPPPSETPPTALRRPLIVALVLITGVAAVAGTLAVRFRHERDQAILESRTRASANLRDLDELRRRLTAFSVVQRSEPLELAGYQTFVVRSRSNRTEIVVGIATTTAGSRLDGAFVAVWAGGESGHQFTITTGDCRGGRSDTITTGSGGLSIMTLPSFSTGPTRWVVVGEFINGDRFDLGGQRGFGVDSGTAIARDRPPCA